MDQFSRWMASQTSLLESESSRMTFVDFDNTLVYSQQTSGVKNFALLNIDPAYAHLSARERLSAAREMPDPDAKRYEALGGILFKDDSGVPWVTFLRPGAKQFLERVAPAVILTAGGTEFQKKVAALHDLDTPLYGLDRYAAVPRVAHPVLVDDLAYATHGVHGKLLAIGVAPVAGADADPAHFVQCPAWFGDGRDTALAGVAAEVAAAFRERQ